MKPYCIIISGSPAVGKTTIAEKLANYYNFKMFNGGDILKLLAQEKGFLSNNNDWWDTDDAKEFMNERKNNHSFDLEVDKKLMDIAKGGNVIITSYTLPWLIKEPIKFWLKGSEENRSRRMAKRDGISEVEARTITSFRDKENKKIYKELYGFEFGSDLSVFDFVLNTDILSLDSLVDICKSILSEIFNGRR